MSNHMKPCATCKHSREVGWTPHCFQGKPPKGSTEYSPVHGHRPVWFYAPECGTRRGAYGDCHGDLHELTRWGHFKVAVKRLRAYVASKT